MSKAGRNFAVGALVAAAAGYVAGILTAPKSGKETRADIKDAAERATTEAERRLKAAHTELTQTIAKVKERATNARGRARKEIDNATAAAEQVREKVRVALSSVHEGESDDKDLEQAVKEAEKSIEHLKKYMKK